jgi:hypothetical protein
LSAWTAAVNQPIPPNFLALHFTTKRLEIKECIILLLLSFFITPHSYYWVSLPKQLVLFVALNNGLKTQIQIPYTQSQ